MPAGTPSPIRATQGKLARVFFPSPFFLPFSFLFFFCFFCYPHGPDIARATMTFSDFLTHVLCM